MDVNELEIQKYYNPKLRRKVEIIGVIISLIIVGISIASLIFYGIYREKMSQEIIFYGKWGLFFTTAFLEFIPQMLSTHLPLFVGISSGIKTSTSVIIVIIASLISSVLAFEIGKKFGWKFTCSIFKPKKLMKIVAFWNKYGKIYITLSALTPLPYFPLLFGALGASRKNIWLWGIIPRIISFILIGYLGNLFN